MNYFRTPVSATSVTIRHSSRCATTMRDTGFDAFLNFVNTCKNFVSSRHAAREVGLRLRAVLALAVVCAASLYCASSASAQTTNGVVTAWGYNYYGECNIPDSAKSGVSAIAGGEQHTIALKGGAVLAWGYNYWGQCNIPASASSGVSAIAGGGGHTIALKDGAVMAWGFNPDGACTVPASANSGVTAIAGGTWHTIALKGSPCLSDLDGSGMVDSGDVSLVLLDIGICNGCATDRDGSGMVDSGDVSMVLLDSGVCPN